MITVKKKKNNFLLLIFLEAVAEILDSLDDIEILYETGRLTRGEILAAVDDYWLRGILEVSCTAIN